MKFRVKANESHLQNISEGQDFLGLMCDYWDDPDSLGYGSDKMAISYLNLKYFDFEVEFTRKDNDNPFLSKFKAKLEAYANNQLNSSNGGKDIIEIFDNLCSEEIDKINGLPNTLDLDVEKEITIIKNLNTTFKAKYKDVLSKIVENIQILDSGKKHHNLFQVIRKSDASASSLENLIFNNEKQSIEESDIKYKNYIDTKELLDNISKDVKEINYDDWKEILNFITKPFEEKEDEAIDQKLVNALNKFKAQVWKIDMIPFDDDTNHFQNFYQLFKVHLQSLNKYLNKNRSSLKSMQDYKDSIFLKNARFDINNTFFIPSNFMKIKKGVYVLVNELMFNSGLFSNSTSNIGPDNIFSGSKADEEVSTYRDIVIKSEPPAIRVMYNIDGEAILGDMSKDGQSSIYDSEELVVVEARVRAKVRRNMDYVYYKNENEMYEQVLNVQSNIYVLSLIGHSKRYFIDYVHLKNYLTEWLMTKALVLD